MIDVSQNSTEGKTEDVVSAVPTSRPSKLSEAKELFAENTRLLNEIREERIKFETAAAELMIGGRSFAGREAEKPKEETPKEYAKRITSEGI